MAADLTRLAQESSEWCLASDVKLLAWLKGFSQDITQRTDLLASRIETLSHDTAEAQADLRNAFTSLHQLSNTQFIEQRIQDEDEISAPSSPRPQRVPWPPIAPSPESFEQNVVPKYREAVQVAWRSLKSADFPSKKQPLESNQNGGKRSRSALSPTRQNSETGSKGDQKGKWVDRPLPLILGTDPFLADEFCGLPPPDTEEFCPPVTEAYERERKEGHFAGPAEDEWASVTEKRGEKSADLHSEGGEVEDGWTQINSREDYSAIEPAVSAALNFRAMLEEALRGPSGLYDDVSSPSTRPPAHEGESDAATSAPHDSGNGADLGSGDHGESTSVSAFREETNPGLGTQRNGGGAQSGGRNLSQGTAKRVAFSDDAGKERPVILGGDQGEGNRGESEKRAGVIGREDGRSYRAFDDDWDEEVFSFGSGKGKPSYALDLDDLFKRKPRTAPLPNGAGHLDGALGGAPSQGHAESQPSLSGLGTGSGASSQAAVGAGSQTVKNGLGVGLGSKNAAVDAITAALKQRQAASRGTPEEPIENRVSDSFSADWVRTPSADGLGKPVSVDPETDRAGDETGRWSPSLTHPPLRTELSFGPVVEHAVGGEATGREPERSGGGGMGDVRTGGDVAHLRDGGGREGEASDGFPAGSGRSHGRLDARTESVRASDSGAGESAGIWTEGEEGTETDRGLVRSGDTRKRGDSESGEELVPQPGDPGDRTRDGGIPGEGNSLGSAEKRAGETSTSGRQSFGFGKEGARSKLFGDSDEDEDYRLPLFGGKLGQRPGGRRRGLFEDSDEEPGGLGFGRRRTGLFDNGYGLEKHDLGGQKQSTGLFEDSKKATRGLFSSDREKSNTSSECSVGAAKSAAEVSPKSAAVGAARKADEALIGAPEKQTALSADLFGDDEQDGELFGLSGLGRHLQDKPGAGETGPKRTSGVSALLESTCSSDEEDPWEGRLAKLKEGQD